MLTQSSFLPRCGFVHNGPMVDKESVTLVPPPPAERDLDAEHRQLMLQLADHPDPQMRILAHISSRQFEMSERLSTLTKEVNDQFNALGTKIDEGFRDLRDRVAALDEGFEDVEERTQELERHHGLNGSSLPVKQ